MTVGPSAGPAAIPLPPAVFPGLAGLAGLIGLTRRRRG
jgi:hypothetical protein